ncbi:hypothetical protein BD779DRAFT_1551719 [Infundibulicybe gibba]|nr:hypothetical protein BD779DRAFT_1551719 [Infundibulicybe gibba]
MLLRGAFVRLQNLGDLEILQDHLLGVDPSGFINHFSNASSKESIEFLKNTPETPTQIPTGSFILPTFCDLHLHAPQFLYQGTGLDLPLMQWLDKYALKAEERLDGDTTLARKVYARLAQRLVENGTGAVLLFGTIKEETNLILAEIMQRAGIRAFVGKLSMDISSRPTYMESSADAALAAAESFVDRCRDLASQLPMHQQLTEPVLTPRFVPTCTDRLLSSLGSLAASRHLRIQSHLAEAHDQVEWVRRERGKEDIDVFDQHNLLTPRTVQAHCTFLGNPDFERLHARGVAIAHCPLSNAYFSSEPFHLREALDRGVKVGLGTDVAGGYSLDIMNAMRQAVVVSRMRQGQALTGAAGYDKNLKYSIDWKEALYLATRGGALALGLSPGSSLFEVGSSFDAQLIRVFNHTDGQGTGPLDFFDIAATEVKKMEISPDMVEKWWCLGDNRNRAKMWVQGTLLHK